MPFDAKDPDAAFQRIHELRPPDGAPTSSSSCSTTSASPRRAPSAGRGRRRRQAPAAGPEVRPASIRPPCFTRPPERLLTGAGTTSSVGMGGVAARTSGPGCGSSAPDDCAPLRQTLRLTLGARAGWQIPTCRCRNSGPMGPVRSLGGELAFGLEHFLRLRQQQRTSSLQRCCRGHRPRSNHRSRPAGRLGVACRTSPITRWHGCVAQRRRLGPDEPFSSCTSRPGARRRAPHHCRRYDDRYQGQKLDDELDALRATLAPAPEAGSASSQQRREPPAPQTGPTSDNMPQRPEARTWHARSRSTPAFIEHTDHHVGRLVDADHEELQRPSRTRSSTTSSATTSAERRGHGPRHAFDEGLPFLDGVAHLERQEVITSHVGRVQRALRETAPATPFARRTRMNASPTSGRSRSPFALGRNAQRDDRALAERLLGAWGGALAVPPRHRRRPDRARGGGASAADQRRRRPAESRSKA